MRRTSCAACWAKGNWTPLALTSKAVRERSSVRPRFFSTVSVLETLFSGGKNARESAMKLAHIFFHSGLVAFDREEIVASFVLHDDARGFRLGVEGVGGDQRAVQLHLLEDPLHGGDFVGIFLHRRRAQPASVRDGVSAGDFETLAVKQLLAIDRNLVALGIARAQQVVLPAEQGRLEGWIVQMPQEAGKGRFARWK